MPPQILVEKRLAKGQEGLFAVVEIKKGTSILEVFPRDVLSVPSRWTIQLTEHAHCRGDDLAWAQYLNHSCEGNVVVRIPESRSDLTPEEQRALWNGSRSFIIETKCDIPIHTELVFNYCTTEYKMDEAFDCLCGSSKCYGKIQGFKFLTREQKIALLPDLAPGLRRLVQTGLVEKRRDALGGEAYGVFAAENLPAGAAILDIFPAVPVSEPTRFTLQLSKHAHIRHEDLQWCAFLNHSCDGNVRIVIPRVISHNKNDEKDAFSPEEERAFFMGSRCVSVITKRPIMKDEQLTFNYCATEFEMAEPFECQCKSTSCYGHVQGFKALDHATKRRLFESGELSPMIADCFANEVAETQQK